MKSKKIIAAVVAISVLSYLPLALAQEASSTNATSTSDNNATSTATSTPSNDNTSTSTATSTPGNNDNNGTSTANIDELQGEVSTLQSRLNDFQDMINALWQKIQMLVSGNTGNNGGSNSSQAEVTPRDVTLKGGSSIDWSGRGFEREQNVSIRLNDQTIATAHADGGGNFSTGSVSLPIIPGAYTYVFSTSNGDMTSSTVTIE